MTREKNEELQDKEERMDNEETRPQDEASGDAESSDSGTDVKEGDAAHPSSEGGEGRELTLEEELARLKERSAALEEENAFLRDAYLRARADFENYKKRIQRETEERAKFLTQKLLEDLLPVLDDFERAIEAAEQTDDVKTLHEGVAMISERLHTVLESRWGLVKFSAAGQPFDPNRHEALQMEEGDFEEPTVIEEYEKGYALHGRILRPARVKVGMPARNRSEETQAVCTQEHTPDTTSEGKGEE